MAGNTRRQWLTTGVTAVAVAGVLVAVLAVVHHGSGTATTPSVAAADQASQQHVLKAAAATTTTAPVSKSPATAATVVYRLTQLLPAGQTSGYAAASDNSEFGQIYLDRGHGTGMLRLDVYQKQPGQKQACEPSSSSDIQTACRKLPDGSTVTITRIPDNCIQSLVVNVDHADGVGVQLNVGTCLAWNGHENPAGVEALTQDEAIRIADDPSWGVTMDSATVAAGAQEFPHLPTFS